MRVRAEPLNPCVGDLSGSARAVIDRINAAASDGVDLVVFPEFALTGYPPRDLLREPGFVRAVRDAVDRVVDATRGTKATAVFGTPWGDPERVARGGLLRNSAVVARDGAVLGRYDKRLLPTYDVFDEARYFEPGDGPLVVEVAGSRVGVLICEDLWRGEDARAGDRYAHVPNVAADLVREAAEHGADVVAVLSASPFMLGKAGAQSRLLLERARGAGVSIVAVNQSGGNDDLVFDGHAAVIESDGGDGARVLAVSEPFADDGVEATLFDTDRAMVQHAEDPFEALDPNALLWRALVVGTRDYARKCGFAGACLGLSGGVDSALTAAVAVAALGAENVLGVLMPSVYSSDHSVGDALALAQNLGIRTARAPIIDGHESLRRVVGGALAGVEGGSSDPDEHVSGVTDENIQSRLRGLIMMGVSNSTGALLLTTGNKSEHAVGYATLYGDMNGGLAPIADVLKTEVYALCRWLNANPDSAGLGVRPPGQHGAVIPINTIEKPPSAELRPDQTDQDSLPEYGTLDSIIAAYVDQRLTDGEIASELGLDRGLVAHITRMIDRAEFKRYQLCVALKVRPVAFGPGRRLPIAQGWTRTRDSGGT